MDGRASLNLREWSATARDRATLPPQQGGRIRRPTWEVRRPRIHLQGTGVHDAAYRREPVLYQLGLVKWTAPLTNKFMLEAGYGLNMFAWNRLGQPGIEQVRGTPAWYANASRVDIIEEHADDGSPGRSGTITRSDIKCSRRRRT